MVAGLSAAPATRAVLADVAVLGPAFTLATDPAEAGRGYLMPLARLVAEPGVLRGQVDAAAAMLRSEDRVAASWVFGGLAGRLVAPVLATAAVHGARPVLAGADLRWRGADAPGGASWWLAAPRLVPWRDADEVRGELVGPLAGLASALLGAVAVSERLLWGEVAAAVATVARIVATARPAAADTVGELAARLLDGAPLLGTRTGSGRATCCLAYRVPGGHTCADCPLGPGRAGADVLARRTRAPRGGDRR
jgi:hypothetical protein